MHIKKREPKIGGDKATSFTVFIDDNFHYMDEDGCTTLGEYTTAEEAIQAARNVIDEYLLDAWKPGQDAKCLFEAWCSFGEESWISPPVGFDAREYARQRCGEVCGERG